MSNSILLAPGPVQLHPEVQKILSLPMIHHRTPEFDQILKTTLKQLKLIFQTQQPVFMLSSTGSGGMECLLINVLHPKDKVLAIVSGKFGERWADIAQTYGAQVIRHQVAWGQSAEPSEIQKILKENPDIQIVLCQACETSTATMHPIEDIAKVVSETPALFLVDGITALGAYNLPMDQWKIDGLVGGSQKAFMLPTGMSYVSFSEKAWKKIKSNPTPKFYFDVQPELAANSNGETYFSSNVSLVRALNYVTNRILDYGLENHFQHIRKRAQYTRLMANHLGLELYSKSPSDSVTALKLPSSIDGAQFRKDLELKYHVTVMGGQDSLKGKVIRIGHMGYITPNDMHQTTMRLAQTLLDHKYSVDLESIENKSKQSLEGQV